MSLQNKPMADVPKRTKQIACAAFPKGNAYMQMSDQLGHLYEHDQFVELFSRTGQPGIAPWRLALVTVMQFAENLTDRQAAEAVRARIDWKYALRLEMEDAGFHYSVLSEFRGRLIAGNQESVLLEAMLERFKEKKLLKVRGKQRTDSTHILAAIRNLNQFELVHETLRNALNELALQAPAWLKRRVDEEWFELYSERSSNYLLPKKETERQAWGERVGQDGMFLLGQIYLKGAYPELGELLAVETLRRVWVQNFYMENDQVRLRERKDQPPSSLRIASPYVLEARVSSKRSVTWTGYKMHLTETCERDSPNFITNVETRTSTEHDHVATGFIHQHLAQNSRLPTEHFVDAGYMSVDQLVKAHDDYGIDLMGKVPGDTSWQARKEGYVSQDFKIDWERKEAICHQNHLSCSWTPAFARGDHPVVKVKFRRKDCRTCPKLALCSNNREKRRTLTILAPQAHFETQQTARRRQQTLAFQKACQVRAGVEGTVSQAAVALRARRSRYRGRAKTHLQHIATAAAINLLRAIAWLNQAPRSVTRQSHFALLAA